MITPVGALRGNVTALIEAIDLIKTSTSAGRGMTGGVLALGAPRAAP